MMIPTRDFGEIEIDEREIVTFLEPIYGFDTLSKFVFLYNRDFSDRFVWLQSLEDVDICFILVDPAMVVENYSPHIPESTQQLLSDDDMMCWLVTVIPDEFLDSTVNLKSPIVVNPKNKRAAQVILEENLPIRFPLFSRGKERGTC